MCLSDEQLHELARASRICALKDHDTWCERAQARERELRQVLPVLVERLTCSYGASRVWLYGSLATGQCGPESDIDLCAEGIRPEDLFTAEADIADLVHPLLVDLVLFECARPRLRQQVSLKGVLLHGDAT